MTKENNNGANLGFEQQLWKACDKLRGNMDPSEYKHVVLGLIFLKYINDSFQQKYEQLELEYAAPSSDNYISEPQARYATLQDKDEYLAENIFYVPEKARWSFISAKAKLPEIGKFIDDAMDAIERDNPRLKGILPKDYARPALDKRRLGGVVDLISTIGMVDKEDQSKDILGRVYEYFLSEFAGKEGKGGGEFYTPRSVVRLLVEMIEPFKGRVYDPCCGSSGMFVQSEEFIEAHGGSLGDISIYGQESNPTTWKLAKMNLAIRGIDANLGPHHGDSFHQDLHLDLKADFIMANPPFNMSDWDGQLLKDDKRWKYGTPPEGNSNFAWVQHMIHHLSPNGILGLVLANGSMSSMTSGEGDIRQNIVEANLVDCMVALPDKLFYGTGVPACLWFIARDRSGSATKGGQSLRDRRNEVLFVDARKMGDMVTRKHRELTDDEINLISDTYHQWRLSETGEYENVPGFCASTKIEEIKEHDFVLTPGRYVGMVEEEDDGIPFEEKMATLTTQLYDQFEKADELEKEIKKNLEGLGFK